MNYTNIMMVWVVIRYWWHRQQAMGQAATGRMHIVVRRIRVEDHHLYSSNYLVIICCVMNFMAVLRVSSTSQSKKLLEKPLHFIFRKLSLIHHMNSNIMSLGVIGVHLHDSSHLSWSSSTTICLKKWENTLKLCLSPGIEMKTNLIAISMKCHG